MKDFGIILFGKKIELPETGNVTDLQAFSTAGENSSGGGDDQDDCLMVDEQICVEEEGVNREDAEKAHGSSPYRDSHTLFAPHDELKEKNSESQLAMMDSDDNPKTPSIGEDTASEKTPKTGTEGDTTNMQPKTLKKPEKILSCPRCDSTDTKFCYYNNCNVNQPRYFCKSCQRYWTAGGTMRNMPVGAGRRKRKNPSVAVAAVQIEVAADSDGFYNSVSFGSVSCRRRENGDDCTSESNATTSNSVAEKLQDKNGLFSQACSIPGVPWFYNPWNSAIPIPAICPPGYPLMPVYPSPYWNFGPWLPIQNRGAQNSLDGEVIKSNGSEDVPRTKKNLVLIPKTLRIDDPDEAAKSSIWATLGIKNENNSRGGPKAFEAKGEEKKRHPAVTTSPILQANPAALSRSLCFQERA